MIAEASAAPVQLKAKRMPKCASSQAPTGRRACPEAPAADSPSPPAAAPRADRRPRPAICPRNGDEPARAPPPARRAAPSTTATSETLRLKQQRFGFGRAQHGRRPAGIVTGSRRGIVHFSPFPDRSVISEWRLRYEPPGAALTRRLRRLPCRATGKGGRPSASSPPHWARPRLAPSSAGPGWRDVATQPPPRRTDRRARASICITARARHHDLTRRASRSRCERAAGHGRGRLRPQARSLYVIRYDHWSEADERGFGEFIAAHRRIRVQHRQFLPARVRPIRSAPPIRRASSSAPTAPIFPMCCAPITPGSGACPFPMRAKSSRAGARATSATPRAAIAWPSARDVLSGSVTGYGLLDSTARRDFLGDLPHPSRSRCAASARLLFARDHAQIDPPRHGDLRSQRPSRHRLARRSGRAHPLHRCPSRQFGDARRL